MRRYGQWAGSPKGCPERPEDCVVEVVDGTRSPSYHQCQRKSGYGVGELQGLLCAQHAKRQEAGRRLNIPEVGLVADNGNSWFYRRYTEGRVSPKE